MSEPRLRSWLIRISPPAVVLAISFAGFAVFLFVMGYNPIAVYEGILLGSFGNISGLSTVLNLSSIYVLTALAAVVAFRARIWNIGGEGQLYAGALGATIVAFLSLQSYLVLPVLIILSIAFGCLWGLVPALLRVKFRADEVVTTVLMNYLVLLLVAYEVDGPMKDPLAFEPVSVVLPNSSRLPLIFGSQINVGFILAIVVLVGVYFLVHKSVIGYRIDLVGGNPSAAKFAGVSVTKMTLLVMLLSASLAGLAGGVLMSGETTQLFVGISNNYGYMGMGVAILAGLEPIWTLPAAIFFSALTVGGSVMQREIGISFNFVQALEAMLIIVITTRTILVERLNKRRA